MATPPQAATVAGLLDAFNREYQVPSPGVTVLAARLEQLLAGDNVIALLIGDPVAGVAVLTLRPNLWQDGPVAVLDELYVVPSRRGHGLGGALVAAAEVAVRQRGGELLEVAIDGGDPDVRRFYERCGFAKNEPDEGEPLLYLYRHLGSAGPG